MFCGAHWKGRGAGAFVDCGSTSCFCAASTIGKLGTVPVAHFDWLRIELEDFIGKVSGVSNAKTGADGFGWNENSFGCSEAFSFLIARPSATMGLG